jgi:phosphohistidine phosphatase
MTVRTLVLLRHAKAANPERVADSDRPLTARGHADAAAAGAWLLSRGLRPARVLCSPSRRTRETWHSVRVALGDAGDTAEVVMEPALYHSGAATALDLIRATDPDVDVLVVVGHNPSVSMISAMLDPGTEVDDDGLRTAGLALHSIDGDWADCGPGSAPLTASHTARAGG